MLRRTILLLRRLTKHQFGEIIRNDVEALSELSQHLLTHSQVQGEVYFLRDDFFRVEGRVEETIDLDEATDHIFGLRSGPCDVYVLSDLVFLVRLSQFELRFVVQIHQHLQVLYELRQ